MFPYLLVFALSLLSLYLAKLSTNAVFKYFFDVIAILLPSLLAGLRDPSIGTDTGGYPLITYLNMSGMQTLKSAMIWNGGMVENAYVAVCYFATKIFNNFNFFLTIISLITILGLFWGAKASKENIIWLFSLFFFMYFNTSLNTERQAMALCMCMPCIAYMIRKNYVMTAVTFFLAFSFHHSAFLFLSILLLYYLIMKKPNTFNRKVTKLVVVVGIVIILASFNSVLQSLVGFGLDSKYVDRYGNANEYGSNVPISLFALNLFNLIIFKIIAAKEKGSRYYTFGEYMMIISFLLCFSGLISTFAVRVGTYFLFVNLLILIHYLPGSKRMWQVSTAGFYVFYWVMTVAIANLGDTYPYQSQILDTIF
jgi:hypothetical protein